MNSIQKIAKNGLILIFSLSIVFHLLVLLQIIPHTIVWGGRITNLSQMYFFETVSIFINLIFLFIILIKLKILRIQFPEKILPVALWVMFTLFLLNTVGNLFSTSGLERIIFTPITLLSSIFVFTLVSSKE